MGKGVGAGRGAPHTFHDDDMPPALQCVVLDM